MIEFFFITDSVETSTSPSKNSKSSHRVPLKLRPQLSIDSRSSQSSQATSTSSQFDRPSSLSSQQSFTVSPNHASASQGHMITPVMISSRVPPPASIITPAKRNEEGFFVNQKKLKGAGVEQVDGASEQEEDNGGGNVSFRSNAKGTKRREFVVKDGALQRSKPGRNVRSPRRKLPNDRRNGQNSPSPKHELATSRDNLTAGNNFQSNMKRSFRYRMITLRAEKPIFVDKIRETSDSEDEDEEGLGVSKGRYEPPVTLVLQPGLQNQSKQISVRLFLLIGRCIPSCMHNNYLFNTFMIITYCAQNAS